MKQPTGEPQASRRSAGAPHDHPDRRAQGTRVRSACNHARRPWRRSREVVLRPSHSVASRVELTRTNAVEPDPSAARTTPGSCWRRYAPFPSRITRPLPISRRPRRAHARILPVQTGVVRPRARCGATGAHKRSRFAECAAPRERAIRAALPSHPRSQPSKTVPSPPWAMQRR